jgi:hypothetical protein
MSKQPDVDAIAAARKRIMERNGVKPPPSEQIRKITEESLRRLDREGAQKKG